MNKIIHGLWIGKFLSPVELLCMQSFIANGHNFHLWIYEPLQTPVPQGVIIEDASEIIPKEKVFVYKYKNQFGHGKGSYAGFSDIFRYKLLYEKGGWWTDMDVVCLKPLDFGDEYVFRPHHDFDVVGNIIKCPPASLLMLDCYNQAVAKVTEDNLDWNLPIAILNDNIKKHKLLHFIKDISNADKWLFVRTFLLYDVKPEPKWYILHLMNEEWRKNKINKNAISKRSLIGKLYIIHRLYSKSNQWQIFVNRLRILFPKSPVNYIFKKIF